MPTGNDLSHPLLRRGFSDWADDLVDGARLIKQLMPLAESLAVAVGEETAWYGPLFGKLLPQAGREPLLVVAICGGTNTGKSLLTNALVGSGMSRSVPEAARTLHPVACLPAGLAERIELAELFPGFVPTPWTSEDDALAEDTRNLLIWRERPAGQSGNGGDRQILLDTPDIDGTLQENWERAELIRDMSDVIVAVLTQQKYNDAVIRDFFRAAAATGKPLIVVVNMVDWPRQQTVIPAWLATFAKETGVAAKAVFVVPHDAAAAATGKVTFLGQTDRSGSPPAADPLALLADADIDALKMQALRGAAEMVLDPAVGLPSWLDAIEAAGQSWQQAQDLLAATVQVKIDLPAPPRECVWEEIWAWLKPRRSGFDLTVSRAYATLGRGVRWAAGRMGVLPTPQARQEDFASVERDALKRALGDFIERLDDACRENQEIERLFGERLRSGDRSAWFTDLERRQRELPLVTDDYRQQVRRELDQFDSTHPDTVRWILAGLNVGAAMRPAVTVALWSAGAAAVPAAAATAGGLSTLVHHVGDVVVGAAASLAGEGAIGATVAGVKPLLDRLFAGWAVERGRILAETLQEVVLGDTLSEMEQRATAGQRPELAQLRQIIARCQHRLATAGEPRGETPE